MNLLTQQKRLRILNALRKLKRATANEVIQSLFEEDIKQHHKQPMIDAGWKYYVHCNKLFAPMHRSSLIEFDGFKEVNGKNEKIWKL